MPFEKLRYGQLYNFLSSLGYDAQTASTYVVYRKVGRKLPVILPKSSKKEEVRSAHLTAVEQVLMLDGVIGPGQLACAIARSSSKKIVPKLKAPTSKHVKVQRSSSSLTEVGVLTQKVGTFGPKGVKKVRQSSPKRLTAKKDPSVAQVLKRIRKEGVSQMSRPKTSKYTTPSRKTATKILKVESN